MEDCVFCKIARKEIPAGIIHEEENVLAFKDLEPKMPVHILIIPKSHIESVNRLEAKDKETVGEMVLAAKKIAENQGISETGYRLIFNMGKDSGQTINHLHLHLMGGGKLPWA